MDKTTVATIALALVGAALSIQSGLDGAAAVFVLLIAVVVISRTVWPRRHDRPPGGEPREPPSR
jgi:hypothetical protein